MSKLRRSMLFLPGANAAMLSTAFIYRPDSIMFDLEDAVALREKDTARLLVFHALQHPMYRDIETVVRINPLSTPFGLPDLEAAVRAGVDVIRLPKTDSPEDIDELEGHLARIERECGRSPARRASWRRLNRRWALSTPWRSPAVRRGLSALRSRRSIT